MNIESILKLFGNPAVVCRAEDPNASSFDCNKIYGLDTLIELNKVEPYSMDFTPNGNYGDVASPGDTKAGIIKADKSGKSPFYNALYLDLDRYTKTTDTGFKTNAEYREALREEFLEYKMRWSFVVETAKGFHLYLIIDPKDRQKVFDSVKEKDFLGLLKYIAGLFPGGDNSALARNKLMRVPGSNHWKTGSAIPTAVYGIDEHCNLVPFDIDKIYYATAKGIINDVKYYLEETEQEVRSKQDKTHWSLGTYSQINAIPFPDIFEKLRSYPRNERHFELRGESIYEYGPNGMTKTDGYKLKKGQNYVNCFSDTFHPIDERPRGPVSSFLFYYFGRDPLKVSQFLRDNYNITVIAGTKTLTDEVPLLEIEMVTYSIIFTTLRVILSKLIVVKGKEQRVTSDLFRQPFEIVGKIWEDEEKTFLIRHDGVLKFMRWSSSKREFNKANEGLFCYAQGDDELGLFMEALLYSDKIQKIDAIVRSGVYDGCVVLGDKLIYGSTKKHIVPNYTIETYTDNQILVKELFEKVSGLYEPFIIKPALLMGLALAGMNLRQKKQVYPALCLVGRSGSGKSSLYSTIKNMLGYEVKAREYAANSVSPKPLKEAAGDNSILSLEEVTGEISGRSEEMVRNVINRDSGAMGTPGQTISYPFRSPVLGLGERTFKDESINNRFVMLVLHSSFLKGDTEGVEAAKGFCCTNDIYKTYMDKKEELDMLYFEYKKKIEKDGLVGRIGDVWAYLFVMNHIFEIGVPYEDLVSYAVKNLENMGFTLGGTSIEPPAEFQGILCRGIMSKKIVGSVSENEKYTKYDIVFDDDFYQKHRGGIHFCLNAINEYGDDIPRITITNGIMVMKYYTKNSTRADKVIEQIGNFISKVGKHAITRQLADYM